MPRNPWKVPGYLDAPAATAAAVDPDGRRRTGDVGAPDERLGEVGVAFVVPADGSAPDPGELTEWARARLADFKVPRRYHLVPELPRNAGGKVRKGELRRTAGSEGRNGG
nr:hypothetical protein [Streptomyces sp. SID8354]